MNFIYVFNYIIIYIFFIYLVEEEQRDISPRKTNSIKYECPDCKKVLFLTPIEILKHKKSHPP